MLLATINLYMGLKTGWWDSGTLTASILGFVALSAISRAGGRAHTALENNVLQTTATSIGTMPATAGLLGALPALGMLGHQYQGWGIALWGIGLGMVGLGIGLLLKRKLLEEEALPFPTAIATSSLISAMYSSGKAAMVRTRALLGSGVATMAAVWFRDGRPAVIPQASFLPISIRGVSAEALSLGISWSPLLLGAGALAGLHVALSLFLGSIIAWGLLAPTLLQRGVVQEATFSALASWLAWPGVSLVLGAAFASVAEGMRGFGDALRDLRASTGRHLPTGERRGIASFHEAAAIGGGSILLTAAIGAGFFHLPVWQVLAAVALSVLLASVCARSVGQTDFAPFGQLGRIAQLVFGPLSPGNPGANVVAGSVTAGDAAQSIFTLLILKTGAKLGASPRRLIQAQLWGILVGALVSVPIYNLLVGAYGIGTSQMPVPSAIEWSSVAKVAAEGKFGVPESARLAAGIAFGLGILLTLLMRRRAMRFLPVPSSLGIAFIIPASYSAMIAAGGLLAFLAARARPKEAEQLAAPIAAGAIAGESLIGVMIALALAIGLLPRPWIGQ